MAQENPIKSVGLCFFRSGVQTELFLPDGRSDAATSLASFIESSDAAILSVENFSSAELAYLRSRCDAASGRRLFVGVDCADRQPIGRGCRCEKKCSLRREDSTDDV
jgi:hypothetical protein